MRFFTVRATLVALVLLAIGPAIAVAVREGKHMYALHVAEAKEQGLRIARSVSAAHDSMVERTHALLTVLTDSTAMLDIRSPGCWDFMAHLLRQPGLDAYTGGGFFSPAGDLLCNSIPVAPGMNVADREWFQRATTRRDFAGEGYQIGRSSGRGIIPFGHPVIDRDGQLVAVALLALSVDWLERMVAQITLPRGVRVTILDEDGVVVAHVPPQPEMIGKPLPVSWLSTVLGADEGVFATTEADNQDVLVAHVPLQGVLATVLVTTEKSSHLADAAEVVNRQLASLLVIFGGAAIAAWFGSNVIARPLRLLVHAARAIGNGDFRPVLAGSLAPVEFTTLQRSFADMADLLEARELELRDSRRRFETLLNSAGEGICGIDLDGRVTFANPEALRLTGWDIKLFIGEPMHALIHHTRPDGSPHPADECPMFRAARQGVAARVTDDVFWRRDGTPFAVEYTVTPTVSRIGLVGAVVVFRDISVRKQHEERIIHLANHDGLTDLPNRQMFEDRLSFAFRQARRTQNPIALLYLDLDRFKPINDQFGHAAGDAVLKEVAVRLVRCVRESDTVARLGGDEFAVLLTNLDGIDSAALVADKIINEIMMPIEVGEHRVEIGVSIGIALSLGDGEDDEGLIKRADSAMYAAKVQGRNRWRCAVD